MSVESPWYRAQADWMYSEWILEMGYPCAGILHWFLGHCKTHGNNRGKCRRIPDHVFARMYAIPVADVVTFLEGAVTAGAITDDGKAWEITAWAEYQSPDAQRKRNERSRTEEDTPEPVRDNNDLSVTNEECPVPCHATLTTTTTETITEQQEQGAGGVDLTGKVQEILLQTPQFATAGINTRLLNGVVLQYLELVTPEVILQEAWGAQRWLKSKPSKTYDDAPGFFRNWLKRAESSLRERPIVPINQRSAAVPQTTADRLRANSRIAQLQQ